jgi:hypothetical protein
MGDENLVLWLEVEIQIDEEGCGMEFMLVVLDADGNLGLNCEVSALMLSKAQSPFPPSPWSWA